MVKINAMLEAVRDNMLDMAAVTNVFYMKTLPHSQALGLPYMGGDAQRNAHILWKLWQELPGLQAEVEQYGKVLSMWATDRYAFISTKGAITKPADLVGKRVLIGSGAQADEVRAWGGIPVQLLNTEVYTGLQRGVGEVFYAPLPTVNTLKLYEVAKDITIIPSRVSPLFIMINHDVFKSLSPEHQKLLVDTSGEPLMKKLGEVMIGISNSDVTMLAGQGCTVLSLSPEQLEEFRKTSEGPMLETARSIFKDGGIEDPDALIKKAYELAAQVK